MAYTIRDWDDTFENYRSRELKAPNYVSWPVRKDSESFQRLVRKPGGALAFGVFAYLVQLAARCNPRGTLRDDRGDITADRIAFRLGISEKDATASLNLLASKDVAWVVDTTPVQHRAPSMECIDAARETPPILSTPLHSIPVLSGGGVGEPLMWAGGKWVGITDADKAGWAKAYPACDIDRQLAAMGEWLKANPAKAVKSNYRRFITSWLSRSQDHGGDAKSNGAAGRTGQADARRADKRAREFDEPDTQLPIVRFTGGPRNAAEGRGSVEAQ